jgi:HEAT repeat protein
MKSHHLLWMVGGVVVLAVVALVLPKSPTYLPHLLARDTRYHDGHSANYWIKALDSDNADTVKPAIQALGSIGSDAEDAVPGLAKILIENKNYVLRIEAALALTKMAPASRGAVNALAQALNDDNSFVRMNAANALFRLKEDARPAIPALIQALKDERNQTDMQYFFNTIQAAVAAALGRASAGIPDGVPALLEALKATDQLDMRIAVARALGEVGAEARSALPILRAMLKDESVGLRDSVTEALEKIEGKPVAAK